MSWYANITLKSGKNIIVDDLQSINKQNSTDSSIKKITDFSTFFLLKGQRLSFVGQKSIVTLMSDEIEYVEIVQND
ncbi:hypothetical protein ODU73_000398 [Thermoclostridium stercorarium]|uniref:hypothetical protein n=1 Tax=Thermoclostridium stercorarium TaxID=1510 RepID=UPI002248B523|nr:hypothetical protein [Thermoclostridium stercorarium]UZQ86005.1 hypothetical protein ODU73_000398 [Thermoclostridium stercorarium]